MILQLIDSIFHSIILYKLYYESMWTLFSILLISFISSSIFKQFVLIQIQIIIYYYHHLVIDYIHL